MIIHQPEIEVSQGEICLSARIETETSVPDLPERLWYRFPDSYQAYLTDRSDGFLVSLFLFAMHLDEPVQVRGAVSPQLAGNMPTIQERYLPMLPGRLHQVPIEFAHLEELPPGQVSKGVAGGFSGGIDSLYALYTHLPDPTKPSPGSLTHGLFIDGYDIFLHQPNTYQNLYQKYSAFFKQLGLQLLTVRTNVYSFTQFRVDWTVANDPALVGTALLFGRLLRHFYKPGGYELKPIRVSRAAYYAVPLMSTESMQIVVDRPDLSRIEKLEQIAGWWGAQQNLRVCINPVKTEDGTACYRCTKCLNTLTFLELLGVRQKYANFPHPLTLWHFIRFGMLANDYPTFHPNNPRFYRKYGRWDLFLLFYLLYIPLSIKPALKRLLAHRLRADWLYRLERWVYRRHLAPGKR